MTERPNIAVLASGEGTNLQALLDGEAAGTLGGHVSLVISNHPGAGAITRAGGVVTRVIDHRRFADRATFELELENALKEARIELVVLAGFDRILGPAFVGRWWGRLVNVHPSLLPALPGMHAVRRAIEARLEATGVTVHFVDEGVDTGPIITSERVEILGADEGALLARVHAVEHRLLVSAVDGLCRGRIRLDGRSVVRVEG